MSIYSVFYEKLPCRIDVLLPSNQGKVVTCLNPYYMELLKNEAELYNKFDYICSDGMLPIIMNRLFKKGKSIRISFDMTSLAKEVFEYLSTTKQGIYFIGSTDDSINKFIKVISTSYPLLNIKGWRNGYIGGTYTDVAQTIVESQADVVVIGMGAPIQDKFAVFLKEYGFNGTIYTCGGFYHQTVERMNYYPDWINKYNLRTLYRLVHERYVWGRLFKYYPRFVVNYSRFLMISNKRYSAML